MLYLGNREPSLDEVFSDPIVRLVLARDGLPVEAARAFAELARRRLRQESQSPDEPSS